MNIYHFHFYHDGLKLSAMKTGLWVWCLLNTVTGKINDNFLRFTWKKNFVCDYYNCCPCLIELENIVFGRMVLNSAEGKTCIANFPTIPLSLNIAFSIIPNYRSCLMNTRNNENGGRSVIMCSGYLVFYVDHHSYFISNPTSLK